MKLSELKDHLNQLTELNFELPDGTLIPQHFHVTEVGQIRKSFIDCGGTVRHEKAVNFQLWEAGDFDHRLGPQKLKDIISLSEKTLGIEDAEIEVEYQGATIGKYGLELKEKNFVLTAKLTTCLAEDQCGVPAQKKKISLSELNNSNQSCCTPGGKCC
ncbi:MAG: hypothetical protein K0S32_1710 [Bacteroidetes bacterium]|jgi:hypothetical protein|nr:hypothetical protein [Bacteroidota bacterium]